MNIIKRRTTEWRNVVLVVDPAFCAVAVKDRKLHVVRQCKNRRVDGCMCQSHAVAKDCGETVELL